MTPGERRLWGRVGAAIARSRHRPSDLTSRARASFLSRFADQVRSEWPDLPDVEVQRRAQELRKAYFAALAARSVRARSRVRSQSPHPQTDERSTDG